ncbi:MAG: hypothetical protein FWE63_04570 [Bacteroidales bacterium]|nr:hypothetical protein [Bacteroidales bacterium]
MNEKEYIKEISDIIASKLNSVDFEQKVWLNVLDSIDCFIIQNKDQEKVIKTFLDMSEKKIEPHEGFQKFQERYGIIPASDKNTHLIKSRMLQGIYRNQKNGRVPCNTVFEDDRLINFMGNERLMKDVDKELKEILERGRLTEEERLFTNLLSSQPLAFNIFLPLKWHNFSVGTAVFKELFPFLNIKHLVDIKMEYVRGDEKGKNGRTTIDRSCFDVFVEYENNNNEIGGIGIEVKYTEPFSQSDYWNRTDYKKTRYIEAIEEYSKQFRKECEEEYLRPKYNQLFRNQLIVELVKKKTAIKNCILTIVHSEKDEKCIDIVAKFQKLIKLKDSCVSVSIEQIVQSAKDFSDCPETKSLYEKIYDRYCNYRKVERFLERIK